MNKFFLARKTANQYIYPLFIGVILVICSTIFLAPFLPELKSEINIRAFYIVLFLGLAWVLLFLATLAWIHFRGLPVVATEAEQGTVPRNYRPSKWLGVCILSSLALTAPWQRNGIQIICYLLLLLLVFLGWHYWELRKRGNTGKSQDSTTATRTDKHKPE